jgi:hypothetical protein
MALFFDPVISQQIWEEGDAGVARFAIYVHGQRSWERAHGILRLHQRFHFRVIGSPSAWISQRKAGPLDEDGLETIERDGVEHL